MTTILNAINLRKPSFIRSSVIIAQMPDVSLALLYMNIFHQSLNNFTVFLLFIRSSSLIMLIIYNVYVEWIPQYPTYPWPSTSLLSDDQMLLVVRKSNMLAYHVIANFPQCSLFMKHHLCMPQAGLNHDRVTNEYMPVQTALHNRLGYLGD